MQRKSYYKDVNANNELGVAINKIEVYDYVLSNLYSRRQYTVSKVPELVKLESGIMLRMTSRDDQTSELVTPTAFTSPDFGGTMTKINEQGNYKYKYFAGHICDKYFFENEYANKVEETLWVTLRMMEERRNFILRFENRSQTSEYLAADRKEIMQEITGYVRLLQVIIKNSKKLNH